jgi:hypothetical protein
VSGHVPATDADRQPLLAIKFPEGRPNPRWSGQCSEEACQTNRARCHAQFGNPASPSKSRRTSHQAPLAFSSSHKLQPFIPHQRKPRLPTVRLPDTYCTMIVCKSETSLSHLYRTKASNNLGTVQQVERDTYREIGGRAPDRRVHFTSCRLAGLHRANRHTKASQKPVTPVRSPARCAAARSTRASLRACSKVRRLMFCRYAAADRFVTLSIVAIIEL